MNFKKILPFGIGIVFFGILTSPHFWGYAEESVKTPAEILREKDQQSSVLKEQIEVLREQGFLGKGKHIDRRYKTLQKNAKKAFEDERYENAALIYYSIVENPEFEKIMDRDEMEFRLIQSLYFAEEDYVALDYIQRVLARGYEEKYFPISFFILVDILNDLGDWKSLEPIFQELNKQYPKLPAHIQEEASYLFGRQAFFRDDLPEAKKLFSSVTPQSRFYARALYHLGVIETMGGNLEAAESLFSRSQQFSSQNPKAQKEKDKKNKGDIEKIERKKFLQEQKLEVKDFATLAVGRVRYSRGKDMDIRSIPEISPLFPVAMFEKAWSQFQLKEFELAQQTIQKFINRFSQNEHYPEALILRAHIYMESNQLPTANQNFQALIDRYEPLVPVLEQFAEKTDVYGTLTEFYSHPQIKSHPELISWVFQGHTLNEIRSAMDTIIREKEELEASEGEWGNIRSSLLGVDKSIVFPDKPRIRPFAGKDLQSPYRSEKGRQLFELERVDQDLKNRITALEEAMEGVELDKGRKGALKKSIEKEKTHLEGLQEKLGTLKEQIQSVEDSLPNGKKSGEDSDDFGGVKKFDELINQEVDFLPFIKESFEGQHQSFEALKTFILHRRISLLAEEIQNWVRGGYLGKIEVAFVEQQNTKGKDAKARFALVSLINAFLDKYPGSPEVPEQLFRMAELAFEQSRENYFKAQSEFDRKYDLFVKGSIKTEPKEPKPDYSESIEICRRILDEFPDYEKRGRTLYLIGYYYEEEGKRQKSIAAFKELIEKYPDSDFVTEGYMRLAENYFDLNEFEKAMKQYKIILRYPDSLFYELALYKLAWSHYRMRQFDQAIEYFLQLVAMGERAVRSTTTTSIEVERLKQLRDLRDEAITYVALSFSEKGGSREVLNRFKQLGLTGHIGPVLKKLADIYFEQLRYPKIIESSKIYIEHDPYAADGAKYQARIIDAYEKLGDKKSAFRERQRLATLFGPKSVWTEKNINNPEAIKDAREFVEESLIYSATLYHEKAQKANKGSSRKSKREALQYYKLAAQAYEKYLWEFPDSPKSYEMRYNYAETLFAVREYDKSGFQYQKVAMVNMRDGKFLKDAAFNSVLSYEKLVERSGLNLSTVNVKLEKISIPDSGKGLIKTKRKKPRTLNSSEKNLLNAYDNYATWVPTGKKVPDILFKSGLLLYQLNHFPPALKRFKKFYQMFPKHRLAPSAVNYILNSHLLDLNWREVEIWSRQILKNPTLMRSFNRRTLDKLVAASILYQAESLNQKGDFAGASEKFLAIDEEFKNNPLAVTGMYNAAAIYEKKGQYDLAVSTLEQLVQKYPRSQLAPQALFKVAYAYEKTFRFEKAAQYYERLARDYPRSNKVPDALYNSALFYEEQGRDSKAATNYLKYAQKFPSRKDAGDAHFLAAKAYERSGQWNQANRVYVAQINKFRNSPDRTIECLTRSAEMYGKLNQRSNQSKQYANSVSTFRKYRNRVGDEGRYFAAKARFAQGQSIYSRFKSVGLSLPQKVMVQRLERKAKLLNESQKVYFDVVKFGNAEYAIASLYQVGKGFQEFSETLFNAPKPRNLDSQGRAIYQAKMEEQAFPLEDKAIEAFQKALNKAHELNAYGPWTQKVLFQLRKYRPNAYPPLYEEFKSQKPLGGIHGQSFIEFP